MLPSNTNFSNFADPSFYTLQQTFDSQPQIITEPPAIEAASFAANTCQQLRKRTGRADRHSKIRTAHGERDRRMRLSVQVAQEFFALQDKLGFDKASKTIDWLLTQAKDSIDQLTSTGSSSEQHPKQKLPTDDHHHTVFTDEYQSVLQFPDHHHHQPVHATEIAESTREEECQLKAKDLRAKARARARERAKEKMKLASTGQPDQLVPAADSSSSGSYSSMEYYYFLLNEILNGGFCGVDFDDNEEGNTSSAGAQFY